MFTATRDLTLPADPTLHADVLRDREPLTHLPSPWGPG
jgi:hypothetical protein